MVLLLSGGRVQSGGVTYNSYDSYLSSKSGSSPTVSAPQTVSSTPKTASSTPTNTIVFNNGSVKLTQSQVDALWKNNPTMAQSMGVPKSSIQTTTTPQTTTQPTQTSQSSPTSSSSQKFTFPITMPDGSVQNVYLTQDQINTVWSNNPTKAKEWNLPQATQIKESPINEEEITNIENPQDKIVSDLESVIDSLVESGKTINPNIKFDDISIEQFLAEAEKTIAPEFKQKFDVALQDLNTHLGRLGYDLEQRIGDVKRQAEQVRLQGRETLAGRGTALSSDRGRFEEDVSGAEERDIESGRELTFRSGQDAFNTTERYLGSGAFKDNAPSTQLAGRNLQFSANPLVGSLESERQFSKEAIARQLQTDEYQRRAFTISSLGFQ